MENPNTAKRELQPGDTVGGYKLGEPLGEGGMGLVFKAKREEDGREVALKVLKVALADDLVFQHRFRQEARAAAEVKEPHLVPILEAAEADGRHFLAVDYVPGGSLTGRIAEKGTLSGEELVRMVSNIASGLDALHAAGIVHRDIKPQNILYAADGTAMLTDFGLAKGRAYTVLTGPGEVMGTLDYLAPELIEGKPATPLTDVYALGCVAFECVAGRAPFATKSLFQVGIAHLEEDPPDPCAERSDLGPVVSAALLTALAKDPAERPQSPGAYAAALRAAVEGTGDAPAAAPPPAPTPEPEPEPEPEHMAAAVAVAETVVADVPEPEPAPPPPPPVAPPPPPEPGERRAAPTTAFGAEAATSKRSPFFSRRIASRQLRTMIGTWVVVGGVAAALIVYFAQH